MSGTLRENIPWNQIPQDSRAMVLPFLSVKDNGVFNIALASRECRVDYLLSHQQILPAYDDWVYTDTNNFQGLRWVLKRGIKVGTLPLRMCVGYNLETDRDRVLHWLVDKKHDDIAREYVRINCDVRDVAGGDYNTTTTLMLASMKGYVEVAKALIATGADVNKANIRGTTPIYKASFKGCLEVVQALIAAGADVDKADHHGWTPIYWATWRGRYPEVVQALLDAGATPLS